MTVNDCQIRKIVKVWTKVQDLQHTGTGANLMSNAMWEVSIQITDKGSPEFWLLSGLKWVLQGSKNRSLHCIMTGNMALIGLTFAEANIIMNYKISWRICIYILVMNCDLSFSYFETTSLIRWLTDWLTEMALDWDTLHQEQSLIVEVSLWSDELQQNDVFSLSAQ